jgi:subtilase family serine protease
MLRAAYGLPSTGGGFAIAIVDAYDDSTALADFNVFARQYGLPVETSTTATAPTNAVFQVVYATGTAPASGTTGTGAGWSGEETLDIEWSHAVAPKAKIYLVEAASSSDADLDYAEQVAAALPAVKEVSNSYGGSEYPGELAEDKYFQHPGVVYFASAGDTSNIQEYPSESPYVVGVGGTTLSATETGYITETAWQAPGTTIEGTGGGPSAYEPIPDYQSVISGIVGNVRGCPDVAAAAATPNYGGAWCYSSAAFGSGITWLPGVEGTSWACPVTAAITNLRDMQVNSFPKSSHRELERIYFNLGGAYYRDVIRGASGNFSAEAGWDFCTGIGSPKGMFPPYTPPETLTTTSASIYNKIGTSTVTTQPAIQADIKSEDVLNWPVNSVSTAGGQMAEINLNFVMDRAFASLTAVQLGILAKAPLGTTQQVFAKDFDSSDSTYGQYIYLGAQPATGQEATFNVNLTSNCVQPGTGAVNLIVRAIQPTHMETGNFTFSVDQVYLAEVTVPAWDVVGPL